MAVTLESLKTVTLRRLQESTTSPNSLFKSDDFIDWYNEFADAWEFEMELPGSPVEYTWAAGAENVALSSISATMLGVKRIDVLNSDGEVTGRLLPRPQGSVDGFFVWNDSIYLNAGAPDSDTTLKVWLFRKATRATAITDNVDLHSGSERAVLTPWFMYQAALKDKQFGVANGHYNFFDSAFRKMMKRVRNQAGVDGPLFTPADDWVPYTG